MSDSLQPHGLQHTTLPCPSSPPRACSDSCPLSKWCHSASCPLLFRSPFVVYISQHQIFSSESALPIRWPKYWSFRFSISLPSEYLGVISIRIDWFDLLAVQGTLKSLLYQHSLKASVLQHSAFFMVKLTSIHDY